jgi:hypothetical protein
MKLYKVEEHSDLVKDMDSKAILNTNYAALLEYRRKKQVEDELDKLKCDVNEIKIMLKSIVSMINK